MILKIVYVKLIINLERIIIWNCEKELFLRIEFILSIESEICSIPQKVLPMLF